MFVTHSMYAAGHPPLPGIEVQTFCSSMPQHWIPETELTQSLKAFPEKDAYFALNYPGLFGAAAKTLVSPEKTYWKTRKMLIGALVAQQQYNQLLIDSSKEDRWGDFSLYDCAACHHELSEPSARQQRPSLTAPGRPRSAEWPNALLSVALQVSGERAPDADQLQLPLTQGFGNTPFGDASAIANAASSMNKQLTAAIQDISSLPMNAKVARRALSMLAATEHDRLVVYDSARQIVWAMQVISTELKELGEPLPESLAQKIDALGVPEVSSLRTWLPAGRKHAIFPENLRIDLELKQSYSPGKLQTLLQEVAEQLAAMPLPANVAKR